MAVTQSISLTQGTQSISNNTTQVTFKWTSTQTGDSWNGYTKTAYYYVSINGGAETKYSVSYTLPKGSTTTIASKTFTVQHNSDGTGSISVRTYMETGISAGTVKNQKSLTLTTIPRASKISSFNGTNLAGNFSVGYTSYHSGFTNKLRISIPNVKALETFNYTSGTSFTLSQATLNYLYSYTSNTDKVALGAVIETWNGSTKIGESAELIHDCYVPSGIKPKVGTVTISPVNITTRDGQSRNVLVKSKNKIKISVSESSAGTGSGIKSYTYEVLKDSSVIASSTTTSTSATLGPFSQVGSLKFRVTVTDNRNRSANNSGNEPTCTCHDYSAPYFGSFNIYRASKNENGAYVADVSGSYIKCDYNIKYSSVNSTNTVTVSVHYNGNAAEGGADCAIINLDGNTTTTYKVYLYIFDNYNGTNKSSTITVFGQSRIFNVTSDGTGFAIGKMAEENELFECRWPAKFNDKINFGNGGSASIYLEQVNNRNSVYIKTGQSTDAGQWMGIGINKESVHIPNAGNSGLINLGATNNKWNQLYAANSTISTSDRNQKKEITDMSDAQEELFNQLKPVTYKMISGTSDRTHYGFISQDVEEALDNVGFDGKDFAGFCKDIKKDDSGKEIVDENGDLVYDYSLRYSEFIALNTYMIQKLQNEIVELKAKIEKLESAAQN